MGPTGWIAMSSADKKALLDRLDEDLLDERAAYIGRERSQAAEQYRESQAAVLNTTRLIGKTGDIELILAAEREILQNEVRFYGNSASMKGSLGNAIEELDQSQGMLSLVSNPELYAAVDASHANAKSRVSGLPKDAARQFFASHNARLLNADKSRLTETEKQLVDARRSNIRVAASIYAALQEQALGKTRSHENSMSI